VGRELINAKGGGGKRKNSMNTKGEKKMKFNEKGRCRKEGGAGEKKKVRGEAQKEDRGEKETPGARNIKSKGFGERG